MRLKKVNKPVPEQEGEGGVEDPGVAKKLKIGAGPVGTGSGLVDYSDDSSTEEE